jgi:hypothetical protein
MPVWDKPRQSLRSTKSKNQNGGEEQVRVRFKDRVLAKKRLWQRIGLGLRVGLLLKSELSHYHILNSIFYHNLNLNHDIFLYRQERGKREGPEKTESDEDTDSQGRFSGSFSSSISSYSDMLGES